MDLQKYKSIFSLSLGSCPQHAQGIALLYHQHLRMYPFGIFRPKGKIVIGHRVKIQVGIIISSKGKALSEVILLTYLATLYLFTKSPLRASITLLSCCIVP